VTEFFPYDGILCTVFCDEQDVVINGCRSGSVRVLSLSTSACRVRSVREHENSVPRVKIIFLRCAPNRNQHKAHTLLVLHGHTAAVRCAAVCGNMYGAV
jgi:hypothetical protein